MKPPTKEAIIAAARERMADAYDADLVNRDRDFQDRRFLAGDQWDDETRAAREADNKPCLTINGLSQYLRQVTSQVRSLNPAIKVGPADNMASDEVAEIYEGMIRHIEKKCDATSVYEAATESAATGGIGYFRVRADYCDHKSFDQELLIERIYNPFAVFIDPLAKHPCRMDMRYGFIVEEIDADDFAAQYPDKKSVDVTGDHRPLGAQYWTRGDTVVVAEYFWIAHEKVKLGLMADGTVVENPKAPLSPIKTRDAMVPRVWWAKVSYDDVLEGPTQVPGKYVPIFAVTGEEIHIGEEVSRSGVIRFAKDPQVLYNFARSTMAEVVTLQPKAPYLVTAKQIAGLETFWNEANSANRPYLPYNPDDKAPPPQRVQPPVSSQGWMAEVQLAAEDMKRTTGIYDAALGAKSNETSGVAIDARKQESQAATSVYADNMVKAITHCGRVLVDMIPHVYDTRRVVRILAPNDQEKQVVINGIMIQGGQAIPVNDLSSGRYDVHVSVGPAYETLRAEAREGMMQFLQAVPQAGQVTADLVAAAQEWPDADQFAERLRKLLPPGMAEDEENPQAAELQQAVNAQLQQIVPQIQQEMMQSAEAAKVAADIRKAQAEAAEAEADADRARAEAEEARLKVQAMMAGLVQQPRPEAPV